MRKIIIVPDDGSDEIIHDKIPKRTRLRYHEGDHVEVGEKLTEGTIDPHELLRVMGPRAVQVHLTNEVQEVYRSQGVPIHDKHVELIVRQMFRRVHVVDPGDTSFLPGDNIDRVKFKRENDRVLEEGGQPAAARMPILPSERPVVCCCTSTLSRWTARSPFSSIASSGAANWPVSTSAGWT